MNYPNFLWSNNQNSQGFFNELTQPPPLGFHALSIDERFAAIESKFESNFDKFMEAISSKINSQNEKYDQIFKNQFSSIHNIEIQLGYLANMLDTRTQGLLPSNTEVNPKEQEKPIIIGSKKELQGPMEVQLEVENDKAKHEKKGEEEKENSKVECEIA